MSVLYIVATPIGNMEDLTFRAVKILNEVDVIAAEDTRRSRKLLEFYKIPVKKLISCRADNQKRCASGIVNLLKRNKNVAYVSDAGTPGISDPGGFIVFKARENGFYVAPIPGVSAVSAIVSVSGAMGKGYVFEGFLSRKDGKRKKRLGELLNIERFKR